MSTVILEPKKIKSATVSTFSPSICYEMIGMDAMIFIFWMLSFKPAFSLSCFTFIKKPFSSSLLYALMVVSSVYLRLLFLLAILIPACDSSSLAFCMMYSAWNLNKQGDDIQPWCNLSNMLAEGQLLPRVEQTALSASLPMSWLYWRSWSKVDTMPSSFQVSTVYGKLG